jgi:hypothetical protein
MLQIAGGRAIARQRQRVMHVVEVLDLAYKKREVAASEVCGVRWHILAFIMGTSDRRVRYARSPLFSTLLSAATVDFQRDVPPVLSDNCFQCHGPTRRPRMAGLVSIAATPLWSASARRRRRPRQVRASLAGAAHLRRPIPPPDASRDCPQAPDSGADRDAQAVDRSGRVVERALGVSRLPSKPPARRSETRVVRNTIDRFLLARLEAEGLAPALPRDRDPDPPRRARRSLACAQAAKSTLYLKDLAPGAYERMVDRYLACAALRGASRGPLLARRRALSATPRHSPSTTTATFGPIAIG